MSRARRTALRGSGTVLAVDEIADRWSYYSWVVQVPSIHNLDHAMNALGAEGWELVTSVTTVKSWLNLTGNSLVFVFKARGADRQPSSRVLSTINGIDPDAPVY